MKKLASLLAATLFSFAGYSQTVGSFFSDVPSYLTEYDTNSVTAQASRIEIFSDMLSGGSLGLSGLAGARFNFKANTTGIPLASTGTGFAVVGMRYAGVGGVISGFDAGGGYSWIKYNVRLSLKLSAGYDKQLDHDRGAPYICPGLWLEKAASKVIPGMGIEVPVIIGRGGKVEVSSTPQFVVKLSATF